MTGAPIKCAATLGLVVCMMGGAFAAARGAGGRARTVRVYRPRSWHVHGDRVLCQNSALLK